MKDVIDKKNLLDQIDALTADGEFSQKDVNYLINYLIANGDMTGTPRDMIQIRRGNVANLPTLAQGELAFSLDEERLYVGGQHGNVGLPTKNDSLTFNVKDYGAKGDGVKDDTTAIQSAINKCAESGGGIVEFPSGLYKITTTIHVGDGSGEGYSSYNNVKLVGYGSGVSNEISNAGQGATRLIWHGVSGGTMLAIKGAILNVGVIGIELDCNYIGGTGLYINHAAYSVFRDVWVARYKVRAFIATVERSTAFPFGAANNVWEKCGCGTPVDKHASGLLLDGNYSSFLDFCRNTFTNCEFYFGGQTGTSGIELGFTDNNVFTECMCYPSQSTGSDGGGKGILFTPPSENDSFPHSNVFYNCAPTNVGGKSGIVGNMFLPYADDSSGVFPVDDNLHFKTFDGRTFSGGKQNYGSRQIFFIEKQDSQSTISTDYESIPSMTQSIVVKPKSKVKVSFDCVLSKSLAGYGSVILEIDGVQYGSTVRSAFGNGNEANVSGFYIIDSVVGGTHNVVLKWKSGDGNPLIIGQRLLLVEELR